MGQRGPRRLCKEDWPFGSAARRALLRTVLGDDKEPEGGWTTYALERACGLADHGLKPALPGAVEWELLETGPDGRWHRVDPEPAIAEPLRLLLEITESKLVEETLPGE